VIDIFTRDLGSSELLAEIQAHNSTIENSVKNPEKMKKLCLFVRRKMYTSQFSTDIIDFNEFPSPEKEVTDDLIQIITVFGSRLYGLRSY